MCVCPCCSCGVCAAVSCGRGFSPRSWSSSSSSDSTGCVREAASVNWGTGEDKVHTASIQSLILLKEPWCCWLWAKHHVSCLSLFFLFFFLEKFWFCRLSLNHKVLHYGDLDESPQGEVPFELLSDKSKIQQHLYFSKWLHVPANKHFITHNYDTFTSRPHCICQKADLNKLLKLLSCFFSVPLSPHLWYQVCGDREGLPSYERKECSEAKQGNMIFICFFYCHSRHTVVLSFFTAAEWSDTVLFVLFASLRRCWS